MHHGAVEFELKSCRKQGWVLPCLFLRPGDERAFGPCLHVLVCLGHISQVPTSRVVFFILSVRQNSCLPGSLSTAKHSCPPCRTPDLVLAGVREQTVAPQQPAPLQMNQQFPRAKQMGFYSLGPAIWPRSASLLGKTWNTSLHDN